MKIENLWVTQHNLKRIKQIPKMDVDAIPPIKINQTPDGEYEIRDGHHRVHALWLAGVRRLDKHQYDLYYTEYPKRRFWKLKDSPFLEEIKNEYFTNINDDQKPTKSSNVT